MEKRRLTRRSDDASIAELVSTVDGLAEQVGVVAKNVDCLGEGFKLFERKWDRVYRPHLDAHINEEKERDAFIREKVKFWKSRAVDFAVAGLGIVLLWGMAFGEWTAKIKKHVASIF